MSVKRLKLVDEFHAAVSRWLKELFRELDHAKHSNFKDILNHLDYSHKVVKELLERAKKYQKRDMEKAKKWSEIPSGFPLSLTAGSQTRSYRW